MSKPPVNDPIYAKTFPAGFSKGDQRRMQILNATIEILARDGLSGFSIDRIAKSLEIRRSHVIYYFADKETLLSDVFRYISATAQEITVKLVTEAGQPGDKLIAIGDGAVAWAEEYPDQARVMLLMYFVFSYSAEFKKLHSQIRNLGLERMSQLLSLSLPESHPSRTQISTVARAIQGAITGLLIDQVTVTPSGPVDYRRTIRELILLLVG